MSQADSLPVDDAICLGQQTNRQTKQRQIFFHCLCVKHAELGAAKIRLRLDFIF